MPELSFIALILKVVHFMRIISLQEWSDSTMYYNSNVLNYVVTEPLMV